jgi:crotonobetainyl-CoA:carnitine CoA-transferase CaiB-like acyl-CoA transferase
VINRNKKSMAVDLHTPGGREIMHRLVRESDVFLSNMNHQQLDGWDLSYDTLHEINPALVYATTTGYGSRTLTTRPAYDMTLQALTGLMTRAGEPGEPPIYLGLGSGDAYCGLLAALGILVALHHRKRTGQGQYVDASLYGSQLFLAAPSLLPYLATRDERYARQRSRREAPNPLWNRYPTSDRWVFLCVHNDDHEWARLCGSFGDSPLGSDERFATAEARSRNRVALIAAIEETLLLQTAAEWMARWEKAGVLASPIQTLADLAEDPQAWQNEYFTETHCDDAGGVVPIRGFPMRLDRTPGRVSALGPDLGAHTELILTELLGYSWEDVTRLQEEGAIP